jgi:hypothetical protein
MATHIALRSRALALLLLVFFLLLGTGAPPHTNVPVTGSVIKDLNHHAEREIEQFPDLSDLMRVEANGDPTALAGVYVPDTLALPVVQQPTGQDEFVSGTDGVATQFRSAARFGTTGLLAHNTLSGKLFFQLRLGQFVTLIYGDGSKRIYQISAIRRFQALQPESPYSPFIDLDQSLAALTSTDVFNQIYTQGGDQVVFQTCIAQDGNPSWGRIMVIAKPATQIPIFFYPKPISPSASW